jgi:hypothetical protein
MNHTASVAKSVEIEPEHDEIERAMDGAVQGAKSNEDPPGVYVYCVHLIRHEEVERERVEKHRNLEQVLQVVRWIGHAWGRELRECAGNGKVSRTDFVAGDESDAATYMYAQTSSVRNMVAKKGPKIAACSMSPSLFKISIE